MKKKISLSRKFFFKNLFTFLICTFIGIENYYSNPIISDSKNLSNYNEGLLATITAKQNGRWTDASTWQGNVVPTINDDVIIPNGYTVTLNGNCNAKNVVVNGLLRPETNTSNIQMQLESMMIENNGEFQVGTTTSLFAGNCVITLNGVPTAANTHHGDGKFIMVENTGKIELHGESKISWTNLSATANAGSNTIKVKVAVNWKVGDEIVLTSTDLANEQTRGWEHTDQATITAISSDKKTITLNRNLTYQHVGGSKSYTRSKDGKIWTAEVFGEVALLTHNIKIQGNVPAADDAVGFGGHMMFMKGSTVHVENIELFKMGQLGIKGRYPFHWHLAEDTAKGHYFKNSSVHKSYNRAVTIHGTDYATVEGIAAFNHIGHGIFFEDAGERFNVIKNNLVFVSKRPQAGKELTPSDNQFNQAQNRTPSSYWITNPNNFFEGNVAAGTEGTGFWFAFADAPLTPSSGIPYFQNMKPFEQPLGSFKNFVVHSCMNGFDLFDRILANHAIDPNWGWAINTNQYIDNGTFYANDQALYCGLDIRGNPNRKIFRNCIFTDNRLITMLAADLVLENCLFNADSDLNVIPGERWFFWFYDGPGIHRNCHFVGWNRPNAKLIKPSLGVGATTHPSATFQGCTREESQVYKFEYIDFSTATDLKLLSLFFRDIDGGFTGKAHTTIVPNHPFFTDGHEFVDPSYKNAARSDYYFANNQVFYSNNNVPNVSLTRTKAGKPTVNAINFNNTAVTFTQFPVIMNEGYIYNLYYHTLPNPRNISAHVYRAEKNGSFIKCFKKFGTLAGLTVTGTGSADVIRVNSLAELTSATRNAYFIEPNGDLYLKRVYLKDDINQHEAIDISWTGDGTYFSNPPIDIDGDGHSDIFEVANARNSTSPEDLNFAFNTNTNFEGWNNSVNVAGLKVENGVISGTAINSGDAHIFNNSFNFDTNIVKRIKVIMKTSTNSPVQLYFTTNTSPNYSADKSITVNYNSAGQYTLLNFDGSLNTNWKGNITGLRLDPTNNLNSTFEVNQIYVTLDDDGDGKSDKLELSNCLNPFNASDLNFDFGRVTNGFNYTNIAASCPCDDTDWLVRNDGSNDPYIYKDGFFMDANQIQNLRFRSRSEATGNYQLYWKTANENFYNEAKSTSVAYNAPNVYSIIQFNLSTNPNWQNQYITGLRIDFPSTATGNSHTWIDYFRAPNGADNNCALDVDGNNLVDFLTNTAIQISPNPTNGIFSINANFDFSVSDVKVYDMKGSLLSIDKKIEQIKNNQMEINLIGSTSGMYLVVVTDTNGNSLHKKLLLK